LKPLIKWPGGKSSEIIHIEKMIPNFDRYIEPFFGGGAVFFDIQPQKALINDISTNLIDFYRLIKSNDEEFKKYMYLYCNDWKSVVEFVNDKRDFLHDLFINYRNDELNDVELKERIELFIEENENYLFSILNEQLFVDFKGFIKELNRTVYDKFKRTKANEKKNNSLLCEIDLYDNILTGFTGGIYMHFRNLYNDFNLKRNTNVSIQAKIANFYFIREYCYGSMFRYNNKGEFNIPYGGISYNNKDFKGKIDNIFDNQVISIFENTEIYNLDFEEFFKSVNLNENDFMFLDPPYDSDFSDYEGRTFGKDDQERLAKSLYSIKAKFILIIKNTDFIFELYDNKPNINILTFDKQYTYNVRSRNERNTEHLLITNLDI
jgi:DNA adenine methylase